MGTLCGSHSFAYGINDSAQVVGQSYLVGDVYGFAIRWDSGAPTSLHDGQSRRSIAYAINNAGQIVGNTMPASGTTQATLWTNTSPITDPVFFETLGGSSVANGINDLGQVVGASTNSAGTLHAMLWSGSSLTDLGAEGTLGGLFSHAYDINNTGQVVGEVSGVGAVLWGPNSPIDLNTSLDVAALAAGWTLRDARGINESGWITGTALNTLTGEEHAFLLSAVPEPAISSLMLVGLVAFGLGARRWNR